MLIAIRGAGDIASGIALRLHRSGFDIIMTELEFPTSIRRAVCFSEAVRLGKTTVEGITAQRCQSTDLCTELLKKQMIPIFTNKDEDAVRFLKPACIVDARLAKKNLGTYIFDAPIVIGVGPGFTAKKDCHAVIETQRGHYLGRALYEGSAIPNTGIPGEIGGYTVERLIRAPRSGILSGGRSIGSSVEAGDICAYIEDEPMRCGISGILRGMLPDGAVVSKGMKSGDVDPRCEISHCYSVSDKALAVGGGVLEAILALGCSVR